jgi:anti-sigma-K factor RskA
MTDLSQEDVMLAGEYVLGLLDSASETVCNARIASDPAFADEVQAWRDRLLPILNGADETPPDAVWSSVQSQIAPALQTNDNAPLRLWKTLTALSGGVAAVLAAILFIQPGASGVDQNPATVGPDQTKQTVLVAALKSDNGPTAITASYNPVNGELLMTPVSLDTGEKFPEIWIVPSDNKARSLGMMSNKGATINVVNAQMRQYLSEGATLAITPEPAGGAPGGKATGPIIASGKISHI